MIGEHGGQGSDYEGRGGEHIATAWWCHSGLLTTHVVVSCKTKSKGRGGAGVEEAQGWWRNTHLAERGGILLGERRERGSIRWKTEGWGRRRVGVKGRESAGSFVELTCREGEEGKGREEGIKGEGRSHRYGHRHTDTPTQKS